MKRGVGPRIKKELWSGKMPCPQKMTRDKHGTLNKTDTVDRYMEIICGIYWKILASPSYQFTVIRSQSRESPSDFIYKMKKKSYFYLIICS